MPDLSPIPFGVPALDPTVRVTPGDPATVRCYVRGCPLRVRVPARGYPGDLCPTHRIRCHRSGTSSYPDPRHNTAVDPGLFGARRRAPVQVRVPPARQRELRGHPHLDDVPAPPTLRPNRGRVDRAGERPTGGRPGSRPVEASPGEFHRAAVEDFQNALRSERKKMEAAFEKAAEGYRDRKDLATAKAILAELESFRAAGSGLPPKAASPVQRRGELQRKLAGTAWQYAEGYNGVTGRRMTLNDDRTVTSQSFENGEWVAIDGERVLLMYANGHTDVVKFNKYMIECQSVGQGTTAVWSGKRLKR